MNNNLIRVSNSRASKESNLKYLKQAIVFTFFPCCSNLEASQFCLFVVCWFFFFIFLSLLKNEANKNSLVCSLFNVLALVLSIERGFCRHLGVGRHGLS